MTLSRASSTLIGIEEARAPLNLRASSGLGADESTAGASVLQGSETMQYSSLLSNSYCAMDRWVGNRCTLLVHGGVPACLSARPAGVRLLLQPVVESRRDAGLTGTS